MGCMGVGAVLSATVVLPRLRAKLSSDAVLAVGAVAMSVGFAGFASARDVWLAGAAMFFCGAASMSIVSSLNVAVQLSTPPWVRARVLSVHMLVFQGAIALGSLVWGGLAARTNVRTALFAASATMLAGLVARVWFRLGNEEHDFSPSLHWPKPMLVCEPGTDSGPVMVMVDYRVAPENEARFLEAAHTLERNRRKLGAFQWEIFRDPAAADRYVETYMVESWGTTCGSTTG